MSEQENGAAVVAKSKTEYEDVTMGDGRTVKFPGKRQLDKTVTPDEATETVEVRFDLRNGDTFSLSSSDLDITTLLRALGNGISQKVGDTCAGVAKVEDMSLAIEEMIGRLKKGEWAVAREAGDSFSGASLVVRAVCEATGKTVEYVKAFLQAKLDAAKGKGEKLSRNDLYSSFRNPNSTTGKIIKRLEEEERAKATTKVNADDLMAEMEAAA